MIRIRKGQYVVCPGQHLNTPPTECLPFQWLRSSQDGKPYSFSEVDGYVIQFANNNCTALFLKREYDFDAVGAVTPDTLLQAFKATEPAEDLRLQLRLSQLLSVPLLLAVWPNDYPEVRKEGLPNPVSVFNLRTDELVLTGSGVDLGSLIFNYRQIAFQNPKPLKAARTYMECRLSMTPNPWPGDLDTVVWDNASQSVKALLEFKTHNLNTPITNEGVGLYPAEDARRFRALHILQAHLGRAQATTPSLLYVVWGRNHTQVKVQIIANAQVTQEVLLTSPQPTNNFEQFYRDIIALLP